MPEVDFPPYAFVPGHWPHPFRDPEGHSHGRERSPGPLTPEQWNGAYALGFALFNQGYYWEAHEAWEDLWAAAHPESPERALLQGLIKLGAVGVKVRQGQPEAAQSLARGAQKHFLAASERGGSPELLGMNLVTLGDYADALEHLVVKAQGDPTVAVERVLPLLKEPSCSGFPLSRE